MVSGIFIPIFKKGEHCDEYFQFDVPPNLEYHQTTDPIEKSRRKIQLQHRAKALGVKTDFDEMMRGYSQADRDMKRQARENRTVCTLDNYTNFTGS